MRVLLVLSLLVVLVAFSLSNIDQLKNAADNEGRSRRLLRTITALYSSTTQMEAGQRAFLLTQVEEDLAPFREARGRIDAEFRTIEEFAGTSEAVVSHAKTVRELVTARTHTLEALIELQREEGQESAAVLAREGDGELRRLRRELDAMADSVNDELESNAVFVERNYRLARAGQITGGVIAVVVLGTLVLVLSRNLRRGRLEAEIKALNARRLGRLASVSTTVHAANTARSVIGVLEEESRRVLEASRVEVKIGDEALRYPAGVITAPFSHRDGRVMGYLVVSPNEGQVFDSVDRAISRQLANMATVAFDNSRLYEQLRETNTRKDEFLATLSHELRNPLAPISNALEIMARDLQDREALRACHGIITRQTRQLTRLVGDLMDISRITRGLLQLRWRAVELGDVVRASVEASRPAIDACGHELTVDLPPDEVIFYADGERVVQVVLNLLNNAARYTPPGGQIHVVGSVDLERDEVRIHVRDSGIGITQDHRDRIFDLFAQGPPVHGETSSGLGVGLALVRQIVRMHGGEVSVYSDGKGSDGKGKGSEFVVVIPRGLSALKAAEAGAENDEPMAEVPLRVLVADDNRDAADTLTDLLRLDGHVVETVYDGVSAVERFATFSPALALLDIGLPGLSGHDVARAIRKGPGGGDATLVALTGWGQEEDRRRSKEAGFDEHLVKPLDPEDLARVLSMVARRRGGSEQITD